LTATAPRDTRKLPVFTAIVLPLFALLVLLAALFYWQYWGPRRFLMKFESLESMSPAEQRKVLHRILRWPGMHHDAYIALIEVGDETSVPFLIRSLQWQPRSTGGLMICTKAHCLEALRKISSEDVGTEYEDWAAWWEENKENYERK